MKTIESEFIGTGEIRGIKFTLLEREGLNTLWYRDDGYYEILYLREQKGYTTKIGGQEITFQEKEIYCTGESWGTVGHGQCVKSKSKAYEIYEGRVESDTKLSRLSSK